MQCARATNSRNYFTKSSKIAIHENLVLYGIYTMQYINLLYSTVLEGRRLSVTNYNRQPSSFIYAEANWEATESQLSLFVSKTQHNVHRQWLYLLNIHPIKLQWLQRTSICSTAQTSSCQEDSVRLVGTLFMTLPNAGRVEVCRSGVWGTVCADSPITPWSEKNAQVVCRQLGYSGALNSILQDSWVECIYIHGLCKTVKSFMTV